MLFRIVCHVFYCWRESKTVERCQHCKRFLIGPKDQRRELDDVFSICYFDLKQYSSDILCLMGQVRAKKITLNFYYTVGNSDVRVNTTENFDKNFFNAANNAFGIYIRFIWGCTLISWSVPRKFLSLNIWVKKQGLFWLKKRRGLSRKNSSSYISAVVKAFWNISTFHLRILRLSICFWIIYHVEIMLM